MINALSPSKESGADSGEIASDRSAVLLSLDLADTDRQLA